ncbi:MAG TPA: prephenate dehydrogenase dimerization domain-containing protein [Thermoanaerobaculia bacterium]|jgi:prephenate dehydrogenase|nr:prephenate dehydrogenase dimerization domain-containing protein [Thermoanaerobaculia bacterium]
MSKTNVLILGAGGGFGTLLASLLSSDERILNGIDVVTPGKVAAERLAGFILADAALPGSAALEAVAGADWVISCMSNDATLDAFPRLASRMRSGALFLDILSVKTPICSLMSAARFDIECLSIHPMFAPSLGFSRQNVVVVRVRGGRHSDRIESLLAEWGAHIHHLTAEQHDRGTAAVQVATHAAIISFGMALKAMDYRLPEVLPISSPVHRTLLALLARIVNGAPEIYWQVQRENPEAVAARSAVVAGAGEFQRLVDSGQAESFSAVQGALREMLGDSNDDLSGLAARVFDLPLVLSK